MHIYQVDKHICIYFCMQMQIHWPRKILTNWLSHNASKRRFYSGGCNATNNQITLQKNPLHRHKQASEPTHTLHLQKKTKEEKKKRYPHSFPRLDIGFWSDNTTEQMEASPAKRDKNLPVPRSCWARAGSGTTATTAQTRCCR